MAPHGNSKSNRRPYLRTQRSTLESVKENLGKMKPKDIVDMTYSNAGGVFNMKSASEVCRDCTQVYNMKGYSSSTLADQLQERWNSISRLVFQK